MSTLLQLQGICVSYGPVEAVHEVNLDVKEGEIVTVIGPNGAGKTMFMRLAAGELWPDPDAGRRLLTEHRVPIDVLCTALTDMDSPYAHTVAAVCQTLPAATDRDVQRARHLTQAGPPAEAVGLQPFTLTVPPRRPEGDR